MIAGLFGIAVGGFLVVLVFGLMTGRIDWRQRGCCTTNPAGDLRMRAQDGTRT